MCSSLRQCMLWFGSIQLKLNWIAFGITKIKRTIVLSCEGATLSYQGRGFHLLKKIGAIVQAKNKLQS